MSESSSSSSSTSSGNGCVLWLIFCALLFICLILTGQSPQMAALWSFGIIFVSTVILPVASMALCAVIATIFVFIAVLLALKLDGVKGPYER